MKRSSAPSSLVRTRLTELGQPIPMRRGSLTERRVKCSRPGCPCKDRPEARHGPYFSLTRSVAGKTQTRLVPAEQVDLVGRQIEAGRQFRGDLELYWQSCERRADEELAASSKGLQARGEKGGSRRRSRRRLRVRSKRS